MLVSSNWFDLELKTHIPPPRVHQGSEDSAYHSNASHALWAVRRTMVLKQCLTPRKHKYWNTWRLRFQPVGPFFATATGSSIPSLSCPPSTLALVVEYIGPAPAVYAAPAPAVRCQRLYPMLLIATAIGGFGSGCMLCLVPLPGQFPPHYATPFVVTMSGGGNTGSVAAAIWSPLAPGNVHQPRWFQLGLPPSALHAWSGVKNSCLCVTSTKSRPSSLHSVFVRGPTSFAVPFGYTSLTTMLLWPALSPDAQKAAL